MPWLEAFPGVNMLMRRPFHIAEAYGMGLYNDMTGHKESTEEWLTWIQEGGDYGQAEEKDALGSMPDFWKTAPSGGEFTSSVSMEQMLVTDLEQTVELVRKSHTTFLGPKYADSQYKDGYDKVLLNMGYRLWISEAAWKREGQEDCLCLTWNNDGVAPLYKNGRYICIWRIPLEIQWRRLKSICFFLLFYQIHSLLLGLYLKPGYSGTF